MVTTIDSIVRFPPRWYGIETALMVAAGIAVAGAVMALAPIPSQPPAVGAVGTDPSARLAVAEGQASCCQAEPRGGTDVRKVIASEFITLDGVFEDPGGGD
jgi:hypothetical protein